MHSENCPYWEGRIYKYRQNIFKRIFMTKLEIYKSDLENLMRLKNIFNFTKWNRKGYWLEQFNTLIDGYRRFEVWN